MPQSATQSAKIQSVLFPDLFDREVRVAFDAPEQSSDGGALLLAAIERQLRVIEALVEATPDRRQPGKIQYELRSLLRQRVFGLCCGYEDIHDAARLRPDPVFRLLAEADLQLASAPTLCRLENSLRRRDLLRMGRILMERVLRQQQRRLKKVRRVTIDMDATADPTYGQQEFSFFNGYYDTYCYLPLLAFATFHDAQGREEAEQYLVGALLRSGRASGMAGARGFLRNLIGKLRELFPGILIRVRLDAGFAAPEMFEFLEAQRVEYVVAIAANSTLLKMAEPHLIQARLAAALESQSARRYAFLNYQAGTWPHPRCVVLKAEVLVQPGREDKDNPRFVVTNLPNAAYFLYEEIYCARGDSENRIKELNLSLGLGRTSCSAFSANQFRVLLVWAAYAILQELRRQAAGTELQRAQVSRLREWLLKIGATLRRTTRRLYVSLPVSAIAQQIWLQIAQGLGAVPL